MTMMMTDMQDLGATIIGYLPTALHRVGLVAWQHTKADL